MATTTKKARCEKIGDQPVPGCDRAAAVRPSKGECVVLWLWTVRAAIEKEIFDPAVQAALKGHIAPPTTFNIFAAKKKAGPDGCPVPRGRVVRPQAD